MADDAKELYHHHANHLPAWRHRNACKLFNCCQVREVIHHTAQIVHAVGVRDIGVPRLPLTHLLCAAMMKAYVRHGIDYDFAIKLESDAQNAVCTRMLRPYVQEEKVQTVMLARHAPLFR